MRGKELISLLQKNGWTLIRIKGSHHIMKKGNQIEVIPVHDKEDRDKDGEKIMIKRCLTALLLSLCLLISGCGKTGINETEKNEMGRKETEPVRLPEDFRFSLIWGVYGISSYDSQTGKLVKTTDTKTPEKYITTLTLDEDEMQMIYGLISSLNLNAYP